MSIATMTMNIIIGSSMVVTSHPGLKYAKCARGNVINLSSSLSRYLQAQVSRERHKMQNQWKKNDVSVLFTIHQCNKSWFFYATPTEANYDSGPYDCEFCIGKGRQVINYNSIHRAIELELELELAEGRRIDQSMQFNFMRTVCALWRALVHCCLHSEDAVTSLTGISM